MKDNAIIVPPDYFHHYKESISGKESGNRHQSEVDASTSNRHFFPRGWSPHPVLELATLERRWQLQEGREALFPLLPTGSLVVGPGHAHNYC